MRQIDSYLSPQQTDRPMHGSRGEESGKDVELSSKTRIAPTAGTSVPRSTVVPESGKGAGSYPMSSHALPLSDPLDRYR